MAVGLAILGGTAAAIVLTQDNASAIVVPPNSVARIAETGDRIESYVRVGTDPVAVAVGVDGVWVANAGDGTVSRLDPATGKLERNIGIGADDLSDIAVGFGSVWVADGNGGAVTRIDPSLNGIQATIAPAGRPTLAPSAVYFVAVGSGYVWATRGDQLLRIDPKTNRVDKRLSVDTPTGLTTGGGSVWVTTQSEQVWRIDPRTVKRTDFLTLSDAISEPVYEGGSLWISYQGEIEEIDPVSFGTGAVLRVAGGPTSTAAGEGALWAVNTRGSLLRFAPDKGAAATASLHIGRHATGIAVGSGAVWAAVSASR